MIVLQIRQLVKVLILNRDYKSGRHMVNADEVAAKIKAVQGVKDCRLATTIVLLLLSSVQYTQPLPDAGQMLFLQGKNVQAEGAMPH